MDYLEEDTLGVMALKKKLSSDLIYLEKKFKSLEEAQAEKEKSRIVIVGLISDAVAAELSIRKLTHGHSLDEVDVIEELAEQKAILMELLAQLAALPSTTHQSLGYFNAAFDLPVLTAYACALERWMGSCRKTVIPIFLSRLRNRNVNGDTEESTAGSVVNSRNPGEAVSHDQGLLNLDNNQDTYSRKNRNVDLDRAVLCIERIEGILEKTSNWLESSKQPKILVRVTGEPHTSPSKIYPMSGGREPNSRPERPRMPVNLSPFANVRSWQQGFNISTATTHITPNNNNITYTIRDKLYELRSTILEFEAGRSACMPPDDSLSARVETILHDAASGTPVHHFSSLLTPSSTPGMLKPVDSKVPTLYLIKKKLGMCIPDMLQTHLMPEIEQTLNDAITEIEKFELGIQAHVYEMLRPTLVLIEEAGNKKLGQKRKQWATL